LTANLKTVKHMTYTQLIKQISYCYFDMFKTSSGKTFKVNWWIFGNRAVCTNVDRMHQRGSYAPTWIVCTNVDRT